MHGCPQHRNKKTCFLCGWKIRNFRDYDNEDKLVRCKGGFLGKCNWKGPESKLKKTYYKSPQESWQQLAGREGWVYKCPKCGQIVRSEWVKVS